MVQKVAGGYTEPYKIRTTGPIRPKFDFKLSIRFTINFFKTSSIVMGGGSLCCWGKNSRAIFSVSIDDRGLKLLPLTKRQW